MGASPVLANGHLVLPISPAAVKISSHLTPLANSSDPCGHVLFGTPLHQNQAPLPFDYQLSSKHSLFARYMATRIETDTPYNISQNILSTPELARTIWPSNSPWAIPT